MQLDMHAALVIYWEKNTTIVIKIMTKYASRVFAGRFWPAMHDELRVLSAAKIRGFICSGPGLDMVSCCP